MVINDKQIMTHLCLKTICKWDFSTNNSKGNLNHAYLLFTECEYIQVTILEFKQIFKTKLELQLKCLFVFLVASYTTL